MPIIFFPPSDTTAGSYPTTATTETIGRTYTANISNSSGLTSDTHQSAWNHVAMLRYTASEEARPDKSPLLSVSVSLLC